MSKTSINTDALTAAGASDDKQSLKSVMAVSVEATVGVAVAVRG